MPPKAVQKSKAAKMAAAMAGSKKGKKKKWSKGKMAEKKENALTPEQLQINEFSHLKGLAFGKSAGLQTTTENAADEYGPFGPSNTEPTSTNSTPMSSKDKLKKLLSFKQPLTRFKSVSLESLK